VGSGKKANVKQNGVWWIASGTGARSVGRCYLILQTLSSKQTLEKTCHSDFVSNDLDVWSSEVPERHNPC